MPDDKMWSDQKSVRILVSAFIAFAAVALVAGASRMSHSGWQMAIAGDVMRWREAMSMLLFAPLLAVCFWLIVKAVGRGRVNPACAALMALSIYLVGCGMGMHDPTNLVQAVYREPQLTGALRRTMVFFDDQLGHWVFWSGFVLGSWTIGLQQVLAPLDNKVPWRFAAALLAVCAALLWVMLTNLWDEYPKTVEDLWVIGAAAALPTVALVFRAKAGLRRMPLLMVVLPAYWGSIIGTLICWLCRGYFK